MTAHWRFEWGEVFIYRLCIRIYKMSQLINRNNKQSGGTFVTIRPADGSSDEFIRSEDDKIILTSLLQACDDIICISVQSSNSIVFACRLPDGINIKLHNERNPEEKRNFCIKVSFVRTDKTPPETDTLTFEYKVHTFNKNITSLEAVNEEGTAQKLMFDTLQKRCSTDFIPDTIAMNVITPDIFKTFTERIFGERTRIEPAPSEPATSEPAPSSPASSSPAEPASSSPAEPAISTEVMDRRAFTVSVVEWIIQQATTHHLNLHIFCMDYFAEHIVFGQYLDELPNPVVSYIDSIKVFHDVGYYRNVYKIVEFVGAYIISILHITGNWNSDLNDGNIMVLPTSTSDNTSNIKLIDFGVNRNLKDKNVRLEILKIFRNYSLSVNEKEPIMSNLTKFLDPNGTFGRNNIIRAFSTCYTDIIMNLPVHIKILSEAKPEDKRKIVFKILMFLAFIDGLIQKQQFSEDSFHCQTIMKYMFTRDIFDSLSTFLTYSSLDYHTYLHKPLNTQDTTLLPVIRGVALFKEGVTVKARYTMLCNIILDKICQHVAELVTEPPAIGGPDSGGPDSGGGKDISKKYTRALRKSIKRTTRPPRRKSGTKRLRRRRATRTSRK